MKANIAHVRARCWLFSSHERSPLDARFRRGVIVLAPGTSERKERMLLILARCVGLQILCI